MKAIRRRLVQMMVSVIVVAVGAALWLLLETDQPELVWTRQFGRAGGGHVSGVLVDSKGRIWLHGSLDREPPAGSLRARRGERDSVGFFARIDPDGHPMKVSTLGESVGCALLSPAGDGSFYVTDGSGDFLRVETDGKAMWRKSYFEDHAWSVNTSVPTTSNEVYVVANTWDLGVDEPLVIKLGSSGRTLWTKMLGIALGSTGSAAAEAPDAAIDPSGNLVITGSAVRFPAGFVLMLSPGGKILWNVDCVQTGKLLSVNADGIYVHCDSYDSGTPDRLAKYALNGRLLWYRETPAAGFVIDRKMALDSKGNVYVLQYKLNHAERTISNTLTKWRADGSVVWKKEFPTQDSTTFTGLALAQNDDIYLCANTRDRHYGLRYDGTSRMLIMKLRQR